MYSNTLTSTLYKHDPLTQIQERLDAFKGLRKTLNWHILLNATLKKKNIYIYIT